MLLTSAVFPFAKPNIVAAWTATDVPVMSGTTSVTYSTSLGAWVATFSQSVTKVLYEWGASAQQRIGQIGGIEPVGTAGGLNASKHELNGWLKWVTDSFGTWDMPPILDTRAFSNVTNEVVTISAAGAGTIANFPIVPYKSITVNVTGTLTAADGTQTTLAGAMELADSIYFRDYTQGKYYDIDMLSGKIQFESNVSVSNCTVTYSYEGVFRDGRRYDAGQLNLTDGRDSGIVGLPVHLDVVGVLGAIRIMVL